ASQNVQRLLLIHYIEHRLNRTPAKAEGAFEMRVIGTPHHPIDTDNIKHTQTSRIVHESRVTIIVPIMTWMMLDLGFNQFLKTFVDQGCRLKLTGHPVYLCLDEHGLEIGVAVENATEDQLPERAPERAEGLHHRGAEPTRPVRIEFSDMKADRQAGF